MDTVTSVLLERGREPAGLRKMIAASLVLHLAAGAAIMAAPLLWPSPSSQDVTPVMTVSLGGANAPGPTNGGLNPIAGRPVQTTEPAPRPEPMRAPAEHAPAMTLPAPKSKPLPKTPPKSDVEEGRGQTPARGTELKPGSAFGDTGAQGAGFGLSTGGLGGGGGYLDVGDFCCPDYLSTMATRINSNWDPNMGMAGEVLVKFTILRDGTLTGVSVERSSGYFSLDSGAERAVERTAKLPPLPAAFTGDHLTVHLLVQYKR